MNRVVLVFLMMWSTQAMALVEPESIDPDSRVKTAAWHEGEVIQLPIYQFATTVIEFDDNEVILDVFPGDDHVFKIGKNDRNNRLYIKVQQDGWHSANLTVETNRRAYIFDLLSKGGSLTNKDVIYRLKFYFPEEELKKFIAEDNPPEPVIQEAEESEESNFDNKAPITNESSYAWAGDTDVMPVDVVDDGTFTYFEFADFNSVPAIFAVTEDGSEELVNYHVDDQTGMLRVESIERGFALRSGNLLACVKNKGFPTLPDNLSRSLEVQNG